MRHHLHQPTRPWHVAAAVAILALVGLASWHLLGPGLSGFDGGGPRTHVYSQPAQPPHEFYLALIDDGFTPDWECPPDVFREITYARFGAAASYTPPEDEGLDARMLGAAYGNVFSPSTVAMLLHVRDEPVVVLVDHHRARVRHDQPILPDDAGLHAHERRLGPLVLVEISPFTHAHVLEAFFEAPKPEKRGSCLGGHDLFAYQ